MRILPLFLALGACAATPKSLSEKPVALSFESAKSPKAWATCVAESYHGGAQMRSDGDHYWLLLGANYDPWNRWDFTPTATGSRAELHSNVRINPGTGQVRSCA